MSDSVLQSATADRQPAASTRSSASQVALSAKAGGISVPRSSPRWPTWIREISRRTSKAGARFGYELLWVLLWSNAMAILVQYLAAKLGIATGRTLPENCRVGILSRRDRHAVARRGSGGHGDGSG